MASGNIYYFNSTCELAVANESFSYQAPLLLREMEQDLAILPFVFASENDFVVTENIPSDEFQQTLRQAGFSLPGFCSLSELEAMPDGSFKAIYPWGWSPAAHFKLKKLKEKCQAGFKASPVYDWNELHKSLFERSTSLGFLKSLLNGNPLDWLVAKELTGQKVSSLDQIELLLAKQAPLVLKAPLSSSGRGIQMIRKPSLNNAIKQWISGVLKQQNYLIAEPFLEKITDLSFQFQIKSESEMEYLGYSVFTTNTNGQYQRTLIHPDLQKIVPEADSDFYGMIETTAEILTNALKKSVYSRSYQGFLGIDAMIFRHDNGLKIQPCIEINCRMNMGILTLYIEKIIHPEATGKFELFYGKHGEFKSFANEKKKHWPPEFRDGKLYSGFVPLVEPDDQNKFGAYISLGTAK